MKRTGTAVTSPQSQSFDGVLNWWIMKTEPEEFSFSDLLKAPGQRELWNGVRNYQARNMMRDVMKVGDRVFIYHSNVKPPGIAGCAQIVAGAQEDPSAFDPRSAYFDAKARVAGNPWVAVTVGKPTVLKRFLSIDELRLQKELEDLLILKKGNRLSVTPVTLEHAAILLRLAEHPLPQPVGLSAAAVNNRKE